MPRIPIIYPKPGESDVADKIRQRRNPQGLIELDGVLLNNPRIAHGWNELFGTIRTENSLPGDLREALILRVAALNTAAYEWIQHEKVGRSEGLSTAQLLMIRDSVKPIRRDFKTSRSPLSSLHEAGLAFADAMTRELNVNDEILKKLKSELLPFENGFGIDRMILDATATVAGYNMVSRVLFTLFVADDHQKSVPIPGLETKVIKMAMADGSQIHVQTQFCPGPIESRPWLVFCNALLTNLNMWGLVTPSLAAKYNLVCFDQRGHGQSSTPSSPCEIGQLAEDVVNIVKELKLPTPIHGLIGVSQGGATTLAVSARHPDLFSHLIVCDTQPSAPVGNHEAWRKRIDLSEFDGLGHQLLSEGTLKQWFPSESHLNQDGNPTRSFVRQMIESTSTKGFKSGAAALYNYSIDEDILAAGNQKLLILVGEKDGPLPKLLEGLFQRLKRKQKSVKFETVQGAGHLPMIDQPLKFLEIVEPFLDS